MAYNKSKFVEAAQKLLNQGKVAQAIAEYQQILRYEPRDQVTLMTIGELYIRQGETFQAIDYFERLAQLFMSDGFLTKAIAVYKRIAKLAPEEIRPLEKLADLYVQQGVMSEARPLFLQLAELHLKNGKQPEAVALLKKLLLAEPDNLRIQLRLADLYQAMGLSGEALEAYVSASQRALARGEQLESEKLADKALHINPRHVDALIIKARAYSAGGNATQAAELLQRVPDLEKGGEPAELLMDLYLKNSKWDEASALALKIFSSDEKNFTATQKVAQALLESGQGERAMSVISRIRIPMIDAGEHENVVHLLNDLTERLPGRLEPLEWLVDTFGRTSDSFRLPDALAHLGDAMLAAGKLDRAKEVYQQLVEREPESDAAKRKLNGVMRKMGLAVEELEPPPAKVVISDNFQAELPEAPTVKLRPEFEGATEVSAQSTAPQPVEAALDEETQKFIGQSLTDVDLFASYGLTQKAIGLLEAILRRAPTHTPTLEKLLDFVLGAGDDRRTAELAAQLEHIHAERGDTRSSERFGELRRRFQRAAGLTDDEIAAAVAASMPQPVEALPEAMEEFSVHAIPGQATELPIAHGEAKPKEVAEIEITGDETHAKAGQPAAGWKEEEVDLSSEWASLLEETKAQAGKAAKPPAPTEKAPQEAPTKGSGIPEFVVEKEAPPSEQDAPPAFASAKDTQEWETPFAEISATLNSSGGEPTAGKDVSTPKVPLLPEEEWTSLPVPERSEVAAEGPEPALPQAAPPKAPATGAEFELDQEFELVLEPETVVPPHEMLGPPAKVPTAEEIAENTPVEASKAPEKAPLGASGKRDAFSSDEFLADLAKEIDQLGAGERSYANANGSGGAQHLAEAESPTIHAEEPVGSNGDPGPLKDVFEEFRAELGEMGAEDEDLETHYNLGVAFREMGLLEEAIGEFQKVAKANDRGKAFRYAMQCCTLLGLAFMEKGQPSIAAIWYERALLTPGIDTESKLALRYDLGVAQESAGELDAALKSFSQVYAVNIDYRDVADRINALQKPTH